MTNLIYLIFIISIILIYTIFFSAVILAIAKRHKLNRRNTTVLLSRLEKPIDPPFPTLKGQNYRLRQIIKELNKQNK